MLAFKLYPCKIYVVMTNKNLKRKSSRVLFRDAYSSVTIAAIAVNTGQLNWIQLKIYQSVYTESIMSSSSNTRRQKNILHEQCHLQRQHRKFGVSYLQFYVPIDNFNIICTESIQKNTINSYQNYPKIQHKCINSQLELKIFFMFQYVPLNSYMNFQLPSKLFNQCVLKFVTVNTKVSIDLFLI